MKLNDSQIKMATELKALKTLKPDEEFLGHFKNTLIAQIEHDLPLSPRPIMITLLTKLALTAVSVIMIIGSIGLSVSYASQINDPESFWYKIKIAAEQIQLSFVENNPMESAALSAKFAQHRLDELAAMEAKSQPLTVWDNVLKLYQQNIQSLQASLEKITAEPNQDALNDLLAIEQQVSLLDQTVQTMAPSGIPTTTIFEAQSLSRFTKQVVQIAALEYSVALQTAIDDQLGKERLLVLYERVGSRFTELNNTWRPRFEEKIQRITADETISPEKSDNYSFTEDEEQIVNSLGQAKTQLGETSQALQDNDLTPDKIMSLAKILLEIDHQLATIEILLK